jgi:hypothetical protein
MDGRVVLDDPHFGRAARRVAVSVASLPPVDAAVDVLRETVNRSESRTT